MSPRNAITDPEEALLDLADRVSSMAAAPNIFQYEPMPKQEQFHRSRTKGRILFGGNRSGKSLSGVADDVMILLHRHPFRRDNYPDDAPIRMRAIGTDFERGVDQALVPYFRQFLPPSALRNGSWEDSYRRSQHLLTLADHSTVSFMSYEQDPDKFQAVSLHHVHFDEEPPKAIFDESMLRLLDTAGSWTMSETPVQQLEWVQDDLIEPWEMGLRPDLEVFYLNTLENTHLDPDEVRAIMANMSAEERLIRISGGYVNSNMVFPQFKRAHPYTLPAEWLPPGKEVAAGDWSIYCSMDHGLANPTAWEWTAVHREGAIVTFSELYSPGVNINDWAALVHRRNAELGTMMGLGANWKPVAYFGDPAISQLNQALTGTTIQQEYAARGIPIGTNGIVKARSQNQNIGLAKMSTYLARREPGVRNPVTGHVGTDPESNPGDPWWQITDACPNLQNELRRARRTKQSLTVKAQKNAPEDIRDKDNHAIDAVKYLFIITGDLRPMDPFTETVTYDIRDYGYTASGAPITTHDINTVTPVSTVWHTSPYSAMEE